MICTSPRLRPLAPFVVSASVCAALVGCHLLGPQEPADQVSAEGERYALEERRAEREPERPAPAPSGGLAEGGSAEGGGAEVGAAQKGAAQKDTAEQGSPAAARVNGVEIPMTRFQEEFEQRARSFILKGSKIPPNTERTYKIASLNHLIDELLVNLELNALGVQLTPEERDAAVAAYKGRFRDESNFLRSLEQSRRTEEEIIAQVVADARLAKHVATLAAEQVDETELQALYDSLKEASYTTHTRVQVSHILLHLPLNAPPALAKKRLKEAQALAREARKRNVEFGALALTRSADLATRDRAGDLGQLERRGDPKISASFEEAASSLQLHALSEPVRTPLGWHIIKLTDRQPAQLKVSHILLKGADADARAADALKRCYEEPFEAVAKELSNDEPSRVRGGDLGFLHPSSPHRLGESFKEEIFKLKLGEVVSFKTPLGVHVATVTAARPERLRASQILISLPPKPSKKQEEEGRLEALSVLSELREGAAQGGGASLFARVARKRSMDETSKQRGGDIGNFYVGGQPTFSREFEAAAFALKLNEVSAPVRSPFGFHVIKLIARAEGAVRPFSDVRPELIEQLKEKQSRRARAVLMQRLRSRAQIERLVPLD